MNEEAWLAVAASVVAIAASAFSVMRWMLQKGFDAKLEKLEARFEHQKLVDYREHWQAAPVSGRQAEQIHREIDAELVYVMKILRATESSLLIPDPAPESPNLVFLSVHGPAAHQINRSKVGPASTAGTVLHSGEPKLLSNPHMDPDFSSAVDNKSGHTTRNMLTIPLRTDVANHVVGVAQFLNKINDEEFTESDARSATVNTASIAMKVGELVRDPESLESLGFHVSSDAQEATLLFCDLSTSATLFQVLDAPGAINCIDEYLTRVTDVALRFGGTLCKYLGDGAMFRFSGSMETGRVDHAERAAGASLEMRHNFAALKESWLSTGWEVSPVFSRSGLAMGMVHESVIGHRVSRQIEIMGETVNRAARLCELAPRDFNSILIDPALKGRIQGRFSTNPIPRIESRKGNISAFQLTGERKTGPETSETGSR